MNKCHSDYWLNYLNLSKYISDEDDAKNYFTLDLLALSQYRRIISNFVSITTNRNIPVSFSIKGEDEEGGGSTDGERIKISASIRKKQDFDWSVGLALHESVHIIKSDFQIIKKMCISIPPKITDKGKKKNLSIERIAATYKFLFNIIEDRYIDSYLFNEAPGYRGYYIALYDHLWNSETASKTLRSSAYRYPSVKSYEFRLCYLTNPATDLDALPGLREMAEKIKISEIYRLDTTQKRLDLTHEILEMVIDNILLEEPPGPNTIEVVVAKLSGDCSGNSKGKEKNKNSPNVKPAENKADDPPFDNFNGDKDKLINDIIGGETKEAEKTEPKPENKSADGKGDTSDLTKEELDKIEKEFENNKLIINHEYDNLKKGMSQEKIVLLDLIEKSGITIKVAEFNKNVEDNKRAMPFSPQFKDPKVQKIDCIVVENLTKELILSGDKMFPMSSFIQELEGDKKPCPENEKCVIDGFRLGKLLGKKLQIRNETNVTKYIRKSSGKIERRLLADWFAGIDNIFYKSIADSYNKVKLHITIDASSSMQGKEKWGKTMTCLTAICVACSMINNIDVSVSFRSTCLIKDNESLPYIVLAYDSEKDDILKIRNLFPFLVPNGCTPEGLAYEAIMDKFIVGKRKLQEDHYFLNISDGQPYYHNDKTSYSGAAAAIHTKEQINKMRAWGINILSYFIESGIEGFSTFLSNEIQKPKDLFSKMYGKDAQYIDVMNIGQVAKTMNGLFLKKN